MNGPVATYTVVQVAEALQKSPRWVQEQVRQGRVRPLRMSDRPGAHIRFTQEDIDALYESLRPATPSRGRRRRRAA